MLLIEDDLIRKEYLEKHIPYRINSMLAHDLLLLRKKNTDFNDIKDKCYGDSLVVEPIFEISIIFARSLLNFIGISKRRKLDILVEFKTKSEDDLTIKSLFPDREYCSLENKIVKDNYNAIVAILKLANKSVAHLTSTITETQNNQLNILPSARLAVYRLVLECLPEIDKSKIWWYTQVECK